jgi:hypothetical protein
LIVSRATTIGEETSMRIRVFMTGVLLSSLILTMLPLDVQAIPTVNVMTCRDVNIQNLGASGTKAHPVGCGRDFPTSLPYVVLYMQFEQIEIRTPFAWQLYAPNEEVYARGSSAFNPPYPGTWTYYIYLVLPVAATQKEIVEKKPDFRFGVLEVGAKAVSEMPGEWRLQVSLGGGSPTVARFTLRP